MDTSLVLIQQSSILGDDDLATLAALGSELAHTWRTAQMFRTRTEMEVSVLNDIKRPTTDAKYWQATREQDVHLGELVSLSYEYRKVLLGLRRLERQLAAEQDEIEREALALEIEHQTWIAQQMERVAHHRIRELREWSEIKAQLEPQLRHGTDDVNAHQLEAMRARFEAEASLVTASTPVADARNILGLAATARRVTENR